MHGVDVGHLQGDVAPAPRLSHRIDGRSGIFREKDEAIAKAKAGSARPGQLSEAENVAKECPVRAEAAKRPWQRRSG